jgi:hypothetical protein
MLHQWRPHTSIIFAPSLLQGFSMHSGNDSLFTATCYVWFLGSHGSEHLKAIQMTMINSDYSISDSLMFFTVSFTVCNWADNNKNRKNNDYFYGVHLCGLRYLGAVSKGIVASRPAWQSLLALPSAIHTSYHRWTNNGIICSNVSYWSSIVQLCGRLMHNQQFSSWSYAAVIKRLHEQVDGCLNKDEMSCSDLINCSTGNCGILSKHLSCLKVLESRGNHSQKPRGWEVASSGKETWRFE